MAAAEPAISTDGHRFDLTAGALPFDFVNTIEGRYDPEPDEQLATYRDLLVFGLLTESLDESTAQRLAGVATLDPDETDRALQSARRIRETIFSLFQAIAAGETPDAADLDALNAAYVESMSHGAVTRDEDEYHWHWHDDTNLQRPIWPVVKEAVDLLLEGNLGRLRECASDDCNWLFLDTSRNASRRWCSMKSCGNRAKVQQYRERHRGA